MELVANQFRRSGGTMVFYRKYRSQTIDELDNAKLRETLYSIFAKAEIPHAFLFTGSKGLGKTSTARIIAKVINCEQREALSVKRKEEKELNARRYTLDADIEPCNVCDTCISITKGTNIDVLEIDGASNRGIDEIRDLREKVRLSPSSAKKKVYIIDEVHMLTTEAFNALLKTIEEPPEHVVFIFCTTEPQKVPGTIISRCTHITLSLATELELLRSFRRIVNGEKLLVDDDALLAIARLANGSFRDGTKILEEISLMAKDQKITKETIESMYKVSGIEYLVSDFLGALAGKDVKGGLEVIGKGVKEGIDMKYFTGKLLETLHDLLLYQIGLGKEKKLPTTNYQLQTKDIQTLVTFLTKAYQEMKYAVVVQLPLEMLVIAWSSNKESFPVEETTINHVVHKNTIASIPYTSDKPSLSELMKKQTAIKVQSMLKPEVKATPKPVAAIKQAAFDANTDPQKALLDNIIYSIKTYNSSIAGVLRGCKIQKMDDASIIFEAAYQFHKERLDDGKSKEMLEKVVKEITGKQLGVQIVLKASSV